MAAQPGQESRSEGGTAAIALVVAAALALVVFVTLANVVTMQLARGAVRAAVDEAVRVGSRSDAPVTECVARARAVIDGLLGPTARDEVVVSCQVVGDPPAVRARAAVTMVPWLPGLPSWSFALEGSSALEVLP